MSVLEHGQLSSWKGVANYGQEADPCPVRDTNRNDDIGEEGDRETEPVRVQKSMTCSGRIRMGRAKRDVFFSFLRRALPCVLFLFLTGCATGYLVRGPLNVDIEEAERTTSRGETIGYALYVPHLETNGCDRMPAVILLHGFQRHYRFHRNNALYMAQRGIVVLTPNMTDLWLGPSAQRHNVRIAADHIAWLANGAS